MNLLMAVVAGSVTAFRADNRRRKQGVGVDVGGLVRVELCGSDSGDGSGERGWAREGMHAIVAVDQGALYGPVGVGEAGGRVVGGDRILGVGGRGEGVQG